MDSGNHAAFPLSRTHLTQEGKFLSVDWVSGLTKREYFAGLVLQGMMANANEINRVYWDAEALNPTRESAESAAFESLAYTAVTQADALITELEKTNG